METGLQDINSTFEGNETIDYVPPIVEVLITSTVSFFSLIANAFIIYAVAMHSYMQTKRNLIILNWAISDFLFHLFSSNNVEVLYYFFKLKYMLTYYCIIVNFQSLFQNASILFVSFLLVDCFFKRVTTRVLPFIWVIFLLFPIPAIVSCVQYQFDYLNIMIVFFSFFLLYVTSFVKLILFCKRRIQRKRVQTEMRFILSTVYVTSWLLAGIINLICDINYEYMDSLLPLSYIGAMLGTSSAIIVAFILIKYDNTFRVAFHKICKCFANENDYRVYIKEENEGDTSDSQGKSDEVSFVRNGQNQVSVEINS